MHFKDISSEMLEIVTVRARHNNATLFMLQQSIYPKNKHARDISLSLKYLFLFKTPRDSSQFGTVARQVLGRRAKWLEDAYRHVTDEAYGCFIIDFRPECKEHLRFRSHMLPSQLPMRVYMARGTYIFK